MKKILAAILVLASSFSVQAGSLLGEARPNTFSYTYVEAAFIDVDDIDVNGFRINGSYDFDPNFSAIGSISFADKGDVNLDIISLGAAYHQQLENTQLKDADFIIHASLEKWELTVDNIGPQKKKVRDDENGLYAGAGLRVGIIKNLEVFTDLSLRTAGDNDFIFTLGSRYTFVPNFSVFGNLEVSDTDTIALGVRYSF